MADAIRIGDPPIEIAVRRHDRARRMILRVGRGSCGPTLTLPPSASIAQGRGFAAAHEAWLRRQLEAIPRAVSLSAGEIIPFRGLQVVITPCDAGPTQVRDGKLLVTGPRAKVSQRVGAFLREAAREDCVAAAARHAARLRLNVGRVRIRDTRGRWGSCSEAGDLMFAWRLILAPPDVLDYVAAHEVAHLVEMNHSNRFWAVVQRLRPDYAHPRDWLRRHGRELLAVGAAA